MLVDSVECYSVYFVIFHYKFNFFVKNIDRKAIIDDCFMFYISL